MITFSPDHNTILLFVFSLTSKTGIHHLDPADGARIALHVPAPHGHRVPLLEREHFVAARLGSCAPRVRGQGAGFLTVFHVGHSGGAEPATETLGRGRRAAMAAPWGCPTGHSAASQQVFNQLSVFPLSVCAQSYLTLCHPMDCSPLGSSVHGISQARKLEWVGSCLEKVKAQILKMASMLSCGWLKEKVLT